VPEEFLIPVATVPNPGVTATALAEPPGIDPALPGGNVPIAQDTLPGVAQVAPRGAVGTGSSAGWFFGTTLRPQQATLLLGKPGSGQRFRLGEITSSGGLAWQAPIRVAVGSTAVRVPLPGTGAEGIMIDVLSGSPLGPLQLATVVSARTYLVDGPLANALTPNSWVQVGFADNFVVFKTRYQPVEASLRQLPHGPAVHGSARVLAHSAIAATVQVQSDAPALLVWSMAWDEGWHAVVTSPNGIATALPVRRVGLLNAVEVPRGLSVVRFTYTPAGFSKGITLSLLTLLALVAGALATIFVSRWRRTTRSHRPQPVPDR
jgi:hypothetical protein